VEFIGVLGGIWFDGSMASGSTNNVFGLTVSLSSLTLFFNLIFYDSFSEIEWEITSPVEKCNFRSLEGSTLDTSMSKLKF
jgi:hypothetical protein